MRHAALVVMTAAVLAAGTFAACGQAQHRQVALRRAAAHTALPMTVPSGLPRLRSALAADLDLAQATIDDGGSTSFALRLAGQFEQLATVELAGETPQQQGATLALLTRRAQASMRKNLAADGALMVLAAPPAPLPHWRIIQPPSPSTLLRYFREAQRRFGVPWEYLAAIELVETKFGRVQGPSSAGAQGRCSSFRAPGRSTVAETSTTPTMRSSARRDTS